MSKQTLLCLCCTLLALTTVSAKEYRTDHFTVNSDLEPAYIRFVQANAEAYYANVQQRYFPTGWQKPLIIYYSKTQADTQNLLNEHAHNDNVDRGRYEPNVPAVYTHQFMNNGELNGWNPLFHQITCHFVHQNFQNPPEWFKEGLTSFLGDQTRIVKGKVIVAEPNPEVGQILKSRIDEGRRFNAKALFLTSKEKLYGLPGRCQFAQVFFCWLNETEQLRPYLANARQKGYEFAVLEETVASSLTKINKELADFIEARCQASAHLRQGLQAQDRTQKQQAFLDALRLKPDCHAVCLEVAKCYNHTRDYENCRTHLKQILNDPESAEFLAAATLMANTYYNQRQYTNALEYYNKAWEYSDCYEYKYKVAYRIANCHEHLENPQCAAKAYRDYLDCNWEPDKNKKAADHARQYLEYTDTTQIEQADCQSQY